MSRYKTEGAEGRFQAGSNDQVLENKLHITSPDDVDKVELTLLRQLYDVVFREEFPDRMLTANDLKHWHRQWLGNVYEWAGRERSVNLTKDSFSFAAAAQVPRLLQKFESDYLAEFTPCHGLGDDALPKVIAVTHVELVLIHPFREGNGRLARLLADVMAVQANCEPLDYSVWDVEKDRYFAAIQKGVDRNYELMTELVDRALTN